MSARKTVWTRYSYTWITLGFFLIALVGHWVAGWFAFVNEQTAHGQAVEFADYAIEMTRDTLENWQSEFLQLIWQVAGLAFLLHVGSPQSKEGDDRKEEKLDAILRAVDPKNAAKVISDLDEKFVRKP